MDKTRFEMNSGRLIVTACRVTKIAVWRTHPMRLELKGTLCKRSLTIVNRHFYKVFTGFLLLDAVHDHTLLITLLIKAIE